MIKSAVLLNRDFERKSVRFLGTSPALSPLRLIKLQQLLSLDRSARSSLRFETVNNVSRLPVETLTSVFFIITYCLIETLTTHALVLLSLILEDYYLLLIYLLLLRVTQVSSFKLQGKVFPGQDIIREVTFQLPLNDSVSLFTLQLRVW